MAVEVRERSLMPELVAAGRPVGTSVPICVAVAPPPRAELRRVARRVPMRPAAGPTLSVSIAGGCSPTEALHARIQSAHVTRSSAAALGY